MRLEFNSPIRPFIVFGTRPEAIKLAPIVKAMRADEQLDPIVCSTGQHREMLDQVIDYFDLQPDLRLDVMTPNQTLATLTAKLMTRLDQAIEAADPDCIIVQGDTTTALVGSMIAFYRRIKCVHVEAGLRTGDIFSPWPEEFNRRVVSIVADAHCAPTKRAAEALIRERVDPGTIHITGNTVIDALEWSVERERRNHQQWETKFDFLAGRQCVLITAHRRESFGKGFENMCLAISQLAGQFPQVQFVYPVHLNPNVLEPVHRMLGETPNVHLIDPSPYPEFVWLMDRCKVILTDSGGIQEEAPTLRKPTVVMREATERQEAAEVNAIRLVGTSTELIVDTVSELLSSDHSYKSMQVGKNPFGDGNAAEAICKVILKLFATRLEPATV